MHNAKLRYLWDPLDCCGTMADGRFLRGHDLNLYHLQYECLGLLSIWVTSLYVSVCLVYLPLTISHRAHGHVGSVGVHFFRIYTIYSINTTVRSVEWMQWFERRQSTFGHQPSAISHRPSQLPSKKWTLYIYKYIYICMTKKSISTMHLKILFETILSHNKNGGFIAKLLSMIHSRK